MAAVSLGMTAARGPFWAVKWFGWQAWGGVCSTLQQEDPRGGATLWDVTGEKEQKWTDEEKEGA